MLREALPLPVCWTASQVVAVSAMGRLCCLHRAGSSLRDKARRMKSLPRPQTWRERDSEPLVVSSFFGVQQTGIYRAPLSRNCVFFSNNPELKDLAESMGWIFELANRGILKPSADLATCSLQSKYVKFLQFVDDYPELSSFQRITYFDHKFFFKPAHMRWIGQHMQRDKAILIRETPGLKDSLSDEVNAALPQERYRKAMPETLEWISDLKANRGVVGRVRIMNTGILHYEQPHLARPFVDEVFQTCWALRQPECQIIFAALSQSFEFLIQRIGWHELNPTHAEFNPTRPRPLLDRIGRYAKP
jgi:hypothetical protein